MTEGMKPYYRFLRIPGIVLVAFGVSSICAWSQGLTIAAIARKSSPAIVLIKGAGSTGPTSGTGFLVSSDGKIVTALHVIEDLQRGTVRLANGETYDAYTVLGYDQRKDIAIIKISGFDLPFLDMGNSNKALQGDPVVLIGNPEGLHGTLTAGIISAVRDSQDGTFKVIQTDAASNPGNSGGPLLNSNGQVIGILDYKMKGSENLNFAIPINYVRGMLRDAVSPITSAEFRKRLRANETTPTPSTVAPAPVESSVRYVASEGVILSLTLDQLKTIVRGVKVPILDEKIENTIVVMIQNYRVAIILDRGKSLKFVLYLSDKYSCTDLNNWNMNTVYAYAYADKGGDGILEMDLFIGSGVTLETITDHLSYFDGLVPKFVKFKTGK